MKKVKLLSEPLWLIVLGIFIVLVGAYLKIMKLSYSSPILAIGLVVGAIGVVYLIYRYVKLSKR